MLISIFTVTFCPFTDTSSQTGDDYRTGVNSCIGEVIRFVTSSDICDTETKTKLLDHLANKVNSPSPTAKTTCTHLPTNTDTKNGDSAESVVSSSADANNNLTEAQVSSQTSPIALCTSQMPSGTIQSMGSYTPNMTSQVNSLQTALTVQNIQSVCPISQTSTQFLPNVPLTILVPANFCTTASGTTCVIPLTLSNSSSEINVGVNPNAHNATVSADTMSNSNTAGTDNDKIRIQLPDDNRLHTNNLSVVGGSNILSQQVDRGIQNLPKKTQLREVCAVLGNKSDNEQSSENLNNPTRSPDLRRSEFSVFQTYQSGKSSAHLHRETSVWRPW